ncbi:MAG: hypothetical protein AAB783_01420 [Patescibacteria group bacterium]
MANEVKFDEWRPTKERIAPPSPMVRFAMKTFGATSESTANKILLMMAVIFFALTAFVIFTMIL